MKPWFRNAAAFCAGLLCLASTVLAQNYPVRPIRLVVPYAPGGNGDISARIIGAALTDLLGQTVVVDNRAGGNGVIGTNLAAKAQPDGYTLLLGASGSLTVGPAVLSKLPYDTIKDFTPISMLQFVSMVVLTSPKTPVSNYQELMALAQAQPGKVTMASAGAGTSNHLAIELLNTMANVKFLHVPYRGSGPALSELLGGQVETMIDQMSSSISHVRGGRLKAIAITSKTRSPMLQNVPTLDELGLKGFDAITFTALMAPAATPRPVLDKLHAATVKALHSLTVRERFQGMGAEIRSTTPAELGAFIREDAERWKKVADTANVRVE